VLPDPFDPRADLPVLHHLFQLAEHGLDVFLRRFGPFDRRLFPPLVLSQALAETTPGCPPFGKELLNFADPVGGDEHPVIADGSARNLEVLTIGPVRKWLIRFRRWLDRLCDLGFASLLRGRSGLVRHRLHWGSTGKPSLAIAKLGGGLWGSLRD